MIGMKSDCGQEVEVCQIPDTDCDEDRACEQCHPSGEVDARQNSCYKFRLTCLHPVTASISVFDSVSWYVPAVANAMRFGPDRRIEQLLSMADDVTVT